MAGGTFDRLTGKVRPGTYINIENARQETVGVGERGVVLLPLIGHSYGPAKEFITLTNDSPDAGWDKLGFSVYDDNPSMLLIREAFKNAQSVIVYITSQGTKATIVSGDLTGNARYGGSRGNALSFSVVASPIDGFDVTVYLDADIVSQYEGLNTIEELIAQDNPWITFSGTGALVAVAGAKLTGGTDGALVVGDITEFLDKSESLKWTTLAFPMAPTGVVGDPAPALYEAVKSKIKYLREEAGKYRKAVIPGFAADYEGIINVTNSVIVNGQALTPAQVTAWVAGVDAGASNTQSNTYSKYLGATGIVGLKSHAEAVSSINNGEFFFSYSEQGDVVVEYDINSLITFTQKKNKSYRKNRVLRVFDTFSEALMLNFPPNKFDNGPVGWDIMEGIGRSILKMFFEAGAIKNVDYDNDLLVDRGISIGDETYFNVGLEPLDSSEKLFFSIKTR